ncbi:MAG: hypothetical protein K2M70_08760, partial [Lachnospiraceae bacterium]|nr:hypothetical protein [Lachnospiraceae bacterium]
ILDFSTLPNTISMLVCYAIPLVIGYFSNYALIFIFMFGISAPAYAAAYLYSGIFKKLEPESEEISSDLDFSLKIEEENEENDG